MKVDSPPPPPQVFQDTVYCVTDSSTIQIICVVSVAMHHINFQHILIYLSIFSIAKHYLVLKALYCTVLMQKMFVDLLNDIASFFNPCFIALLSML